MTDFVELHNIAFFAHHGLHPEETKLGQRFFISLRVELDLRRVGASDSIGDTVHYGDLHAITAAMQGASAISGDSESSASVELASGRRVDIPVGPFRLLETLAHQLALVILRVYESVDAVEVQVRKPSVPIAGILDHAAIGVRRVRDDLRVGSGRHRG